MKIAGYQLEKTLSATLKPVYLLTGDDAFLRYEAESAIQQASGINGFSEKIKWSAQSENEEETLANLLFSNSLFESKQYIELNFHDKFPTPPQQKILESAFKKADSNKLITIQCKKLDDKTQKSSWFQAINHIGCVVTIWPLNYDQLKSFIISRAKKYRLIIDTDAITLLANFSEGNVSVAAQTLEKAHILDDNRITPTLIAELISHDNQYTIFDLGDALLINDLPRMLRILENLRESGIEPTLVLWSLTREVRVLTDCLLQKNNDNNLEKIFKQHKVLTKKQEMIRRHLKHHSLATCYQWLQHAFLIDQKIKHFLNADAWRELQIFCMRAL